MSRQTMSSPRLPAAGHAAPIHTLDAKIIETGRRHIRPDGSVSMADVSRAMGVDHHARIGRLKDAGLWPWPSPRQEHSGAEDREAIEARKLEVLAEIRAGMIDGTGEVDQPPPGMAPCSNRDHAEWSRRKFEANPSGACYQPSFHRTYVDGRRRD